MLLSLCVRLCLFPRAHAHIAFRRPILSYAPFEMSSSKLQSNLFFISFLKVITPPGPSRHTKKEMKEKSAHRDLFLCVLRLHRSALWHGWFQSAVYYGGPDIALFRFASRCRLSLRRLCTRQATSNQSRFLFSSPLRLLFWTVNVGLFESRDPLDLSSPVRFLNPQSYDYCIISTRPVIISPPKWLWFYIFWKRWAFWTRGQSSPGYHDPLSPASWELDQKNHLSTLTAEFRLRLDVVPFFVSLKCSG